MNPLELATGNRRASIATMVVLLVAGALSVTGCNKLKARDALNKGVQSYKNALFDDAIEKFKTAKELDPDLINARLYLATAYFSQYIPGAPSEENLRKGQQAIAEWKEVLEKDPDNLSAIDGIASCLFQMAATPFSPEKFEESKRYHFKHIALKPDDPEPYYSMGVINWTLTYRANTGLRADYNATNPNKQVKDEQPLPPKVRAQYAAKYGATVEEGIEKIKKAIELRPDYEAAMAYLNLLYRRKADMVETAEERDALLRQADELLERVKAIKQKKMETAA